MANLGGNYIINMERVRQKLCTDVPSTGLAGRSKGGYKGGFTRIVKKLPQAITDQYELEVKQHRKSTTISPDIFYPEKGAVDIIGEYKNGENWDVKMRTHLKYDKAAVARPSIYSNTYFYPAKNPSEPHYYLYDILAFYNNPWARDWTVRGEFRTKSWTGHGVKECQQSVYIYHTPAEHYTEGFIQRAIAKATKKPNNIRQI